jgi:hypothetical protein
MSAPIITEQELEYLVNAGLVSATELKESDEDPDTTVRDGIAAIVAAIGAIKFPDPVAMPAMPKHPAPIVNVTIPKRGTWTATVVERDRDGYIRKVTFKEEVK